jgi:hypothetical protein
VNHAEGHVRDLREFTGPEQVTETEPFCVQQRVKMCESLSGSVGEVKLEALIGSEQPHASFRIAYDGVQFPSESQKLPFSNHIRPVTSTYSRPPGPHLPVHIMVASPQPLHTTTIR